MRDLTQQILGSRADAVSPEEERNGYVFWGLIAVFVGVPELLAAVSHAIRRAIPWPTISSLVGGDLEAHHHWTALVVVALIVLVAYHTLTYPPHRKLLGQPVGKRPEDVHVVGWRWGLAYALLTAVVVAACGAIAAGAGASKSTLGYAIYVPLAVMGVVVPSAFRHFAKVVLSVPTLFATIALLRERPHCHWVAASVVALLVVLCFHLALYPWPNYHFGSP